MLGAHLTSKMATHLSRLKGKYDSIDFATAIAAIIKNSPMKKPSHKILVGKALICIQLDNTDRGHIRRPLLLQLTSQVALFRVHLSSKLTKKDAESPAEWLWKLNRSDYSLSFDGLYDTNLSLLFVRAPYSIFVYGTTRGKLHWICEWRKQDASLNSLPLRPTKWTMEAKEDKDV